jgi:NAD(P)-dependent dehydrogenase (short-subunit alcohol dehydrogenase family)
MPDSVSTAAASSAGARSEATGQVGSSGGSLRGRVVVITGGSRGLGAAIAQVLAEQGARLVLADLALERAQALAVEMEAKGIDVLALPLDVGDEQQVERLVNEVVQRCGRIDAVINNAAIDITVPIAELSGADWERVVRTNLSGPFLLSKYASAAMQQQQGSGRVLGHIVNIASTASKRAWPNAAAYHATKWGLLGLSHALHAELRPLGIKVSAIVAGGMRTPFLLDRFPDIDPEVLQDPMNVARSVAFVLTQPEETVIPELMVLPMRESSWP